MSSIPRTTSATAATPAPPPLLGRRLRALGVSGRRIKRGWTHERTMDVLRTLVYVVPLTLLVWVWAQDQQIEERALQNVPIYVEHLDGQKVVTILQTATGESVPRSGRNVLATLTFRGPRIGLNAVLRMIANDQRAAPFNIRLRGPIDEQVTVSLVDRLNELDTLRDAGVRVAEATPSNLIVSIEDRKQVEARIVAENVKADELAGPVEFNPPTVTLSGPASAINEMVGADGQVTLPVELRDDRTPGEHREILEVHVPERLASRVTPAVVRVAATYALREKQEQSLELPFAVPVITESPAAWDGKVVAFDFDPLVLPSVRVRGPANVIEALRRDRPDPLLRAQIKAVVTLERDDEDQIGELITREAEVRLPEGVVLDGEPPRVSFRIRRVEALE